MDLERSLLVVLLLGLAAAPALLVWRHPVRATIAILAYLAFEELLILGVPSGLYAAVRLAPEGLLSLGAVSAIVRAMRRRDRRTELIWPEVGMVVVLLLGIAIAFFRDVSLVHVVIGVRWLFRYASVYAIWRLEGSAHDRRMLVWALGLVVTTQALIGLGQALLQTAGVPVLNWMQASSGSAEVGGVEINSGGSRQQLGLPFFIYGTLARYHRFGIFIAIGAVALSFVYAHAVRRDQVTKISLVLCGIALLLSTSRQAILLLVLALAATAWLRLGVPPRVARAIRGATIMASAAVVIIVATGALATLLGESALVTRLVDIGTLGFRAYYLAVIVPNVLSASDYLGLGIGTFGSRPHVLEFSSQYIAWGFPGEWALQFSYDSEWAILLGQMGVIGFALFYASMWGFGARAWRGLSQTLPGSVERALVCSAACLGIVMPLLGVVGAELGSRTSAYLVWSILGAAMSALVTGGEDYRARSAARELAS